MTTLITRGAETLEPIAVEMFDSEYESGNIIHPILGREDDDVTLRPAGLASGSLSIVVPDLAAATTAIAFHRAVGTFQLSSTAAPDLDMTYVVTDRISRTIDPETLGYYRVLVPFKQVIL